VTNNGIEASLKWKDFTISYAGDWKAAQRQAGSAPTITSPSKNVQFSVDQVPATTTPATTAQQTIQSTGTAASSRTRSTSKPVALGPLIGVTDTYSTKGSAATQMVIVMGNELQQVIIHLTIKPNAPPEELVAVGEAIGSLTLTS